MKNDNPKIQAFTFGDPEPTINGRVGLIDMLQSNWNGKYYLPPITLDGISSAQNANTHHKSAIQFKANQTAKDFISNRLLHLTEFRKMVMDFLVFGNAYLEVQRDRLNRPIKLIHSPAKYTRRTKDGFVFIQRGSLELHHFAKDSVFHLLEHDINQEIYGIPYYLAALQSIWLNEAATLFRRKYFKNGSHAGFILYLTDPTHNADDVAAIDKALQESKGPGNFRNMFVYSPNGKKDGLQVIPISEVMAKDEFMNVKDVSRDDILVAHRMPPQLMGLVPKNTGGFGSVTEANEVFYQNEIKPIQQSFLAINDWLGEKVVDFNNHDIDK